MNGLSVTLAELDDEFLSLYKPVECLSVWVYEHPTRHS